MDRSGFPGNIAELRGETAATGRRTEDGLFDLMKPLQVGSRGAPDVADPV